VLTAETDRAGQPPTLFELVGHPLRWRLLRELAHSDRRVGELCVLVDEPQSLVSYHLGRLRSDGMVVSRRSAADGRDTYYVADLNRYRELVTASASALHPGLRVRRAAPANRSSRDQRRSSVLFLCTGNSARSQIAEALTTHLSAGAVEAVSAGSNPKALHPEAVSALAERGIDISGRSSKHLDRFTSEKFAYVVTLCDRVREVCPEFPGHPDAVHWSVQDPSRGIDGENSQAVFARTLAEIESRVEFLLELIASKALHR
jgi:ArsR family transcriptional regulator, arsenate/arsenite/antimonite-responsive transcriptional repressor / arsenate reductase (thioredoxin)